jgi:hypothetical protein
MAQAKATLSGYVKDAKTGETLIGAIVYTSDTKNACSTNLYGFYSLSLAQGNYQVMVSFIGYKTQTLGVELVASQVLNVELEETVSQLNEVVITSKRADEYVKSSSMGFVELDMKQAKAIPVIFGESDVLKTLQLSTGVKSAGEGSSGFYVRGGSADQNLILLDEAPVYNASHLLGFFSVFNTDALKNVEMIKGGMPANYGGRISSVVDVKMNEGNTKDYKVSGGIGLISSRITAEGPIKRDKASFIISGRRTYADLFISLMPEESISNMGLYFYDLNAKANWEIDQNNRIFLSGYFGRDVFNFNDRFGFDWGNSTATLRWNHLFSDRLFLNSSLVYSNYNYVIGMEVGSSRLDIKSGIEDINLKEDFSYFINPNNSLKFGFNIIHHTFLPGEMSYGNKSMSNQLVISKRYALDNGLYILNDRKFGEKLKVNYGLRISNFNLIGPGQYYNYDAVGITTDTLSYEEGDFVKTYNDLEPRISASYILNSQSSLKASYTRNYQNLHLLTKSTSSSPSDLWIPSSNIVKPQLADQYSLGYYRNFNNNTYNCSAEIYYKDMRNQIDYKNGADLTLNTNIESQLVFGKGRAYGLEVSVEKKEGRLTGFINYTLSRTERSFDAIDNGQWFAARQDRTHDLNIMGMYKLSERLTLSATWVFYTGDATTFPAGKYKIDGYTVNYYSDRNAERMPDYHRLDLGLTFQGRKKAHYESSWNFSLYNVYARKNAYTISFRESESNALATEAVRLSLFSIVPSITYNFKF